MEKWVRANYQPNLPLGEDGRRITACAEHLALARKAGTEGMVLLKNAGKILIVRFGMVTMACFLVFIYDDRWYLAKFPGDMHPHIAFAACGSSIMDHIHGRFVALVYMGFQLALLHHLVYD